MLNIELPNELASTPRCAFESSEDISAHKNLYMNIHNSIIRNSQKMKATPCPSTDHV